MQKITQETHVQEVVGVVSKITQKIDRLENTIDDLVKRLSRQETSSRSSNITSDFETSESSMSEKTFSKTTSHHQTSQHHRAEEKPFDKSEFAEKVKQIGNHLKLRQQPDRYIRLVKNQCDQYGMHH